MLDAGCQAMKKGIQCAQKPKEGDSSVLRQRCPGPEGAQRRGTLTSLEVGGFLEEAAPGLHCLEKVKHGHEAEGIARAKARSTQRLLVTTMSSSCLERSGRAREMQEASSGGLGGLTKDFRLKLIKDGEIPKVRGQGESSPSIGTPWCKRKRHLLPHFTSEGKVREDRC